MFRIEKQSCGIKLAFGGTIDKAEMQIGQKLFKDAGSHARERHLDASKTADWEEVGKHWLADGTDPDA